MAKQLEEQLEFNFIEIMRNEENRDLMGKLYVGFASLTMAMTTFMGLAYLKLARPEILDSINRITEKWPNISYNTGLFI